MHDNALARAMIAGGVDCLLQPVYTPIRTDEPSVANDRVFFGGIHIYLLQRFPWLRFVPEPIRRTLDWAPLLNWVTRQTHSTDAAKLGELAVSMLKGSHGHQSGEVRRLTRWMADEIQPDAVLLSNLLIGGALPSIRDSLPQARIAVLLQGDDIFLDFLPPKQRSEAIQLCRGLVKTVDTLIVHSDFYAEKMGQLFEIPDSKIAVTPLSIDVRPFGSLPDTNASSALEIEPRSGQFRLGYLARIAPEKGLHHLVDAFVKLAVDGDHDDLTLHVAGWLGDNHRPYFQEQVAKVESASLAHRFTHHGSPALAEKISYLKSLDLLCVPTDYHDPKGLFALEALAAGVPILLPDHGAFGELVKATGGGRVYAAGEPDALVRAVNEMKRDPQSLRNWSRTGSATVHTNHSIERAAENLRTILFE